MERVSLTLGGLATHAFVEGQGPALVLLHGSADTPLAWQAVATELASRFRVWAPALPPITGGLALDNDLPWLDQVMGHTGARVLGGHSYGALLALRWTLAHPSRVDRLALAEPIAWGIARAQPGVGARLGELDQLCIARFAAGQPEVALEWLVDYWNGPGFWARLPEKVRAGLVSGAPRTHAEVGSGGADLTSTAELATLRVPTRMVAGANSTAESLAVSRAIAAALPDAKLTVIEGAGHQFLRSHPQLMAAACAA